MKNQTEEKKEYAPPMPEFKETPTDLDLVSEANGHTIFKSKSSGKLYIVINENLFGHITTRLMEL